MKWRLFFDTVRYLKAQQLVYQIYYRLRKPRIRQLPFAVLRGKLTFWSGSSFLDAATVDGKVFTFLGVTACIQNNWDDPKLSKIWWYNLHYQDDLNAVGWNDREGLSSKMVDSWINSNSPPHGNGWEPYCLSLRIINWVKFFSRLKPLNIRQKWLDCLAQQADILEQRLEFHILANHLFANAKALVFVGSFLGGKHGDRWLYKGLKLLDQQMSEQFLDDGAHYERSPMYQGILLWDLADLMTLSETMKLPEFKVRYGDWRERFNKGLNWLRYMSHPDRKVSFFNDATFGIAPSIEDIERYASSMSVSVTSDKKSNLVQGRLLQPSGYGVFDWPENHRMLADLAPVGPDYQPGHAHADTLSCELSLFGHRVLVNSGISEYGEGAERYRQRSTSAHNTVEVNGQDSSEVWAGFRVARRARPLSVSLNHSPNEVELSGGHDGYKRFFSNVIHYRTWCARAHSLEIRDELFGRFDDGLAHWHFHPDVSVGVVSESRFKIILPKGQVVIFEFWGGFAHLESASWHPGFGVSQENQKLLVGFTGQKLITRISWGTD
jgi:uncharacterized heparinase superfamily protein